MPTKKCSPSAVPENFSQIDQNQNPDLPATIKHLYHYLESLLENLEDVEEHPRHHPESDALFHSLQVFHCAQADTCDPVLWAAALLHDIGKSVDYVNHETVGSELISGLLCPKIAWLISHHLDLLKSPLKTRRTLRGTQQLKDLELLRRWDLNGRQVFADVTSIRSALDQLFEHYHTITNPLEAYTS